METITKRRIPCIVQGTGTLVGNGSIQTEIDIMGEQDKDMALFGECKWTNEKVDAGVLETLIRRSKIFRYSEVYLYLFAKNGFTKGCVDAADRMGNVTLVQYKELLEKITG